MHVFIDTNILLNFYHFTKDELDALHKIFASHQGGAAIVHITKQVCDEFKRNRENKIKDALKRFEEVNFSAKLPSFMKPYGEYQDIQRLCSELQGLVKNIKTRVNADISAKTLVADNLINEIFNSATVADFTREVFESAYMRLSIGNPPGKKGSVGDAINWTLLLRDVPHSEPLHIISEDGDFYSTLNEDQVHPFLEEEWRKEKASSLYVYRTLSGFMSRHFDGVALSFDKNKQSLINDLATSFNFASTHNIVAQLQAFRYYSLNEVERILEAAKCNNQFGWIVTDTDVSDFLNRIAVPRIKELRDPSYRDLLIKVTEEQRNRMDQSLPF